MPLLAAVTHARRSISYEWNRSESELVRHESFAVQAMPQLRKGDIDAPNMATAGKLQNKIQP